MCGIAGTLGGTLAVAGVLENMAAAIQHRGPDSDGFWRDEQYALGFAHKRLSVVDLTQAGAQPMHSPCGRYVLAFNGEIYNHAELRSELASRLAGHPWRGHSDSETLLAGLFHWGVESCLNRLVGMFSFALWDRQLATLTLARDRLGEKPLYYGKVAGGLVFASELAAIQAVPGFDAGINRYALASLLQFNNVAAPLSIYSGISKLPAGSWLQVTAGDLASLPAPKQWWSAAGAISNGRRSLFVGDESAAVERLDKLLSNAVGLQMEADVPLGAFLSGGIDSSTVVALMQAQSTRSVNTFTIGFHEGGYNEADHAKAVAAHLGTSHTELYIEPAQALDVIPKLPALYSEPFADSSQIPTFLVSQLARQHVTVALSGDGGDELFGGYNRYILGASLWRNIEKLPAPLRKAVAVVLLSQPVSRWNRVFQPLQSMLPGGLAQANVGEKLHKAAGSLAAADVAALYESLVSHWADPSSLVIGGDTSGRTRVGGGYDVAEQMMAMDTFSYLPDDILCKVDRAAMGVSLETRVPMLDHRVVEFAWQLPSNMKIRDGVGKWALREVLYRYVPRELMERPKMGFAVPLGSWLSGALRDWVESLIDPVLMRQQGYIRPEPVRAIWSEHLAGKRNHQDKLWNVLMFQAWLAEHY